jgi:hypothetical protein
MSVRIRGPHRINPILGLILAAICIILGTVSAKRVLGEELKVPSPNIRVPAATSAAPTALQKQVVKPKCGCRWYVNSETGKATSEPAITFGYKDEDHFLVRYPNTDKKDSPLHSVLKSDIDFEKCPTMLDLKGARNKNADTWRLGPVEKPGGKRFEH